MSFSSRQFCILHRWASILLASLAASLVGCFLLYLLGALTTGLASEYGKLPLVLQYVGCASFAIVASHFLLRVAPLHVRYARSFFDYPPIWTAAVLGIAIIWWFDQNLTASGRGPFFTNLTWVTGVCLFLLGAAASLVCSAAGAWLLEAAPAPRVATRSASEREGGNPQPPPRTEWADLEKPVEHWPEDLLDRRPMAERFARLLLAPLGQDVTLGLAGEYGSGKTSVVNLVKESVVALRKPTDPAVVFHSVNCWAFDDSSAALRGILQGALGSLAKHIDCLAVMQIPESYLKSIAGRGGWWASVMDLATETDSNNLLRRIAPILVATDTRLVIAVEDLDRKQGGRFDPQDVLATLDRLRSVRGVSFILTADIRNIGFLTFSKLCDHYEDVRMESGAGLKIVGRYRQECAADYRYCDPLPPRDRQYTEAIWDAKTPTDLLALDHAVGNISLSVALNKLIRTPRVVKHAARSARDLWIALHGEIDLDDLFISMVLRNAAPEAFDFVVQRADVFRTRATKQSSVKSDDEQTEALRTTTIAEWNRLANAAAWDAASAKAAIFHLFPHSKGYFDEADGMSRSCPQGLQHYEPVDYWRRMIAGELDSGEVRDQQILREIELWNKADPKCSLAAKMCENERFAEIWEHFALGMRREEWLELATQVFQKLIERDGPVASGESPAAAAIYRRCSQYGCGDKSLSWLMDQISWCLPLSLRLANDCYGYWSAPPPNSIIRPEGRKAVRLHMVGEAKKQFGHGRPGALLKAIDGEFPYSVCQLLFPSDSAGDRTALRSPGDWEWFGPSLLAALELDPRKMVPQLAHLVVVLDDEFGERGLRLNEQVISGLFGSGAPRVLRLIATEIDVVAPREHSEQEAAQMQAVRALAKAWLSEHSATQSRR